MKFKKYSSDFSNPQEVDLPLELSFEGDKGLQALRDYIIAAQANLRQGNACTKTRAQVSGTGKKPWRQKGTGMARHGSKRSPIWVGGGVAHGPKPRDYSKKVNRRVKDLAFRRAFSDSAGSEKVELIEAFQVTAPKTKELNAKLAGVSTKGSVLFVDEYFKDDFVLAARNISRVYMIDVESLNAWDLVRHDKIIISDAAFAKLKVKLENN